MFHDIDSESLTHLLTSVHRPPQRGTTSLPSLMHPGTVLEIRGPPSSGKTHLLYFFLILCIIPEKYQSIELRGREKAALVFDMELGFDVARFDQLLRSHLLLLFPDNKTAVSAVARRSLERLHIFRPVSSLQLAATVFQLAKYHASCLTGEEIGLLAIDSMSANFWPDRFTLEQARTCTLSTNKMALVPSLQHILTAIESFRLLCGFMTIITNWALPPAKINEPPSQRNYPHPSPFSCLDVGIFTCTPPVITLVLCRSDQCMASAVEEDGGVGQKIYGSIVTPDYVEMGRFVLEIFAEEIVVV